MKIPQVNWSEKFAEFLSLSYYNSQGYSSIKSNKSVIIDFSDIIKFDTGLGDYILDNPIEAIKFAEEAFLGKGKELFVRFNNLPNIQKINIRDIRSKDIGKLIYFDGTIRQSSDVRPQISTATFTCKCGTRITINQNEEKFRKPSICNCGSKYFQITDKHFVDVQRIVVEESSEDLDGGSQPKRVSVILKNDLVEPKEMRKTTPGNKIRVIGYVQEVQKQSKFGGVSTLFDIQVQANFIEPLQEDFYDIVINDEDVKQILEFSKKEDLYETLTNSIAPTVLGLSEIKQALLFQLFGGVKKVLKDGTIFREMVHILLCGEPGVAKSKLATFISKTAPKARYLAGKGASSVGLTASVVHDEFTKNYVLEAGALVLTNNGICVLDELDKMREEDTSALHEALEQGTISVSKANIQARLQARTSLLACANPKFGRFDAYKSISEQIDMPPALINRFDMIFILKDLPNDELDDKIATHILTFGESADVINKDFFRKYIAYAKQKINPVMSLEAENAIKSFYISLRKARRDETQAVPISPRQLEALMRLSQASAKIRLSETVSIEDSKRAIGLLKYSLSQVGIDPKTGELDIDMIQTGIPTSKRNKLNTLLRAMDEMGISNDGMVNVEELTSQLTSIIDKIECEELISQLTKDGRIINPKYGYIQRI